MPIAPTVENELLRSNCDFQLIHHRPTHFSLETARVARVPPQHLAKAVLLRDAASYLLAVIPADSSLSLEELRIQSGRDLKMAREHELALLFHDCIAGAVPALGGAYGIETWVDERLAQSPDIYFEAGDHELLVRMATQDLMRLLQAMNYGHFSAPRSEVSPRRGRWARNHPSSPSAYPR